jgi:preprotein translocase subunit SecE
MAGMQESMQGVKLFFAEVVGEMKKTDWPGRQELIESTVVVIVSLLMLSAFVGVFDKALITLLTTVMPR